MLQRSAVAMLALLAGLATAAAEDAPAAGDPALGEKVFTKCKG